MNFVGIPDKFASSKNARIVIIPVPFDVGSSWLKGSENGPDAMFSAAENMELYDLETNTSVHRQWDIENQSRSNPYTREITFGQLSVALHTNNGNRSFSH
ncbi:MAG: arginase family protein [Bacteroidales bacterium]